MKGKTLKGQFFMLGALALVVAFAIGLNIPEGAEAPRAEDISIFTENLRKDLPMSLNFGLNEGLGVRNLENFTLYTKSVISGHYIDYSAAWVVTETLPGPEINVTFGNYWGSDLDVNLTVNGNTVTLLVPNNSTQSVQFAGVPTPLFTLSVVFNGESRNIELVKEKMNLYGLVQLERGDIVIREEIIS